MSTVASPRRLVAWHVREATCDRSRRYTSTIASISPPASSATRTPRLAAALNEYQTEFLIKGAQGPPGSSASSVASAVAPRTFAGSVSACAAARASFGGGAAAAEAVASDVRAIVRKASETACGIRRIGRPWQSPQGAATAEWGRAGYP